MTRRSFLQSGFQAALQSAAGVGILLGARRLAAQGMRSRNVKPAPRARFSGKPWPVTFKDVTAEAGLNAPVVYGEEHVKRYIFEANGPGIAFFDYDHDGWLDIFVPSGTRLDGFPSGQEPTNRLYHNNRNGTFTDVTEKSGLRRTGWCTGVCIGDYDNDGRDDLFLTYYGQNVLYHNNGDGTFTDVTSKAGLAESRTRYGTGCTFVDYDRDGHLDLFVARYIDLDLSRTPVGGANRFCQYREVSVNCGPLGLPKETCSLYHNNGDGTFTEVSEKAGILKAGPRWSLGAIAFDYNNDGWPDIFVACDSSPNLLFRNNHDGTFTETGTDSGCGLSGDGQEQANMGIALGDYDADGYFDLYLTHFSGDIPALYHSVKGEFFDDVTYAAGLAVDTQYVGWGTGFVDFDNDGWLDLFEVTGTVYPEVEKVYKDYPYRTERLVYRNLQNGTFEEVSELCGPAVLEKHSSRGCAFGDFNNDGSVDALVFNMSEPASLLQNVNPGGNHWLSVKCVGTKSNRSGIGARVTVEAGGRRQMREVLSGSSYLSQSDLRQHFGLGSARKADSVEVRWLSGQVDRISSVDAGKFITIEEGSATVKR
jgi:enediyne biosynthesis protein E4